MPFQKGQRVRQRNSGASDTGIITGTYSINVPEIQYDVCWDLDGSMSECVPENELEEVFVAPAHMIGQRVETKIGEGVIAQIGETFPVRYGVKFDDKMGTFWFFIDELTPSASEPKMRLFIYVAPYSLILTPNDTDMTELLLATARLFQQFTKDAHQSVEVMRAMGEVCRLAKEKLGPFIELEEES